MPEKEIKVKVENVVASTSLERELDLEKIAAEIDNTEYEPEQFPGLICRLEKPKTAVLIFRSGKLVCTGANASEIVMEAINKIIELLGKIGMEVTVEPKINVQNMVASSDLYGELNLDKIAFTVDNAEFEPEQFPGLVFRMTKPKVVFLLFRSGKIVCTGAKREEDIRTAIMNLLATLRKLKVIKER